ncbi:MAG: hypothetical protein JST54_00375 [Deltaproteobacteria bacterium]|nr:hypothetical protein [Deltaproteobacteria bacterium]
MKDRFRLFKSNELAKLGLAESELAEKIFKKDLKLIVDAEVEGHQDPTQVIDVKALNQSVNRDSNTMGQLLKRAGMATEVDAAKKQHNGTLPVAQALLALAQGSSNGAVRGLLPEFKSEVTQLSDAQARQAAGGHPAFDLKVSKAARECWIHTDMATHILAALLLREGIVNDPVYTSRPTVKSVLRPVLEAAPTSPASKKGHKKGKTPAPPAPKPTPAPAS